MTTSRLAAFRHYLRMDATAGALPELDGLRALAIVLVLFRHAVVPFRPEGMALVPIAGWDAATPLVNGWMGVDLFFVLSGFLITHHLCRRYGGVLDRRSWGDYLVRRALRIVPAYYAMIAVVAAGLVPLYAVESRTLADSIGHHLLFMQDYLGSDLLVVFWSLGVEEKFYLLAPLVLAGALAVRTPTLQYALVCTLALLPMLFRWIVARETPAGIAYPMYFQLFRSPFHLGFDGLAMGMLCALVYRDRARWPLLQSRRTSGAIFWAGTAIVGSLLVTTPLFDTIDVFDEVPLGAVLAVGMSGMLLGLALGGGPSAWFRGRRLFVVSKLSYTLYLVHYALIPAATALADAAFGEATRSPLARFALFLPIYLALSFVGAAVLHYLVEKPFLVLRDHGIGVRFPTTRPLSTPLGRAAS